MSSLGLGLGLRKIRCGGFILAFLMPLFGSITASAQLSFCRVQVAFERIGVTTLVPITNGFHAVIVIDGEGIQPTGYEANPTGRPPNWGTLVARERNMALKPLKALYGADGLPVTAGDVPKSCPALRQQMRSLVGVINGAGLPYAPVPEAQWNAVNSNSFAYWALRRLNLEPPPAPWGTQPYGYDADISDQ